MSSPGLQSGFPGKLFLAAVQTVVGLDLVLRVFLAETNRAKNLKRLSTYQINSDSPRSSPRTVASVVGYREDAFLFERALKSYFDSGCDYIVVGIDGNDDEDEKMIHTFRQVFGNDPNTVTLRLDSAIGTKYIEQLDSINGQSMNRSGVKQADEADYFARAYEYMKTELLKSGFDPNLTSSRKPQAVCFTQPHRDLKEVRFSSWMLSIVLADLCNLEFMWSSDSDTVVLPDTIRSLTQILHCEPAAGGATALVRLNNSHQSVISCMAATAWATDIFLNRSSISADGRSECLNGPCSAYRISAVRQVMVPWYRCRYPGSPMRTVINEDIQATMLLAKRGWQRIFSDTSIVYTAGPETFRGWLGQRIRWSRGIQLHRRFDTKYILSQGPILSLYMLRSAIYDSLLFIWLAYFSLTGHTLVPISRFTFVTLELLPPLYNFCRAAPPDLAWWQAAPLYVCYRLICPVYRMYTWFTPFNSSWGQAKVDPVGGRQKRESRLTAWVRREQEMIFAAAWFAIVAIAVGRVGSSSM